MATTVDWFFDVISPFAYLQLEQFDALQEANDIVIRPRPLVLVRSCITGGRRARQRSPPSACSRTARAVFARSSSAFRFACRPRTRSTRSRPLRLTIAMGGSLDAVRAVFRISGATATMWHRPRALPRCARRSALQKAPPLSNSPP